MTFSLSTTWKILREQSRLWLVRGCIVIKAPVLAVKDQKGVIPAGLKGVWLRHAERLCAAEIPKHHYWQVRGHCSLSHHLCLPHSLFSEINQAMCSQKMRWHFPIMRATGGREGITAFPGSATDRDWRFPLRGKKCTCVTPSEFLRPCAHIVVHMCVA